MIILVNGAFGAGKTTVAKLLVDRIPKSVLFDPEIIGFVLQRLPRFMSLKNRDTEDFQDIPLWRRLTALTALILHKTLGRTIIIPMAFCKLEYLNQIRSRLLRGGVAIHHFCLTAPVEVIHERLRKRGVNPLSAEGQWVYPRAARCCETHIAPEFGKHINTNNKLPSEVADDILENIWSV
jgi:predicted kinase